MEHAKKTTFAELISYPRIRARIDNLRELFSKSPESVVPWVGAGLSLRYGMPLWSSFVRDLILKMPADDRLAADHLRSHGLFDLAADFAHMRLGDSEFASSMVGSFNRNIDHTQPHPITRLHSRLVVTTNYDRVIDVTMPWLLPLLPRTFSQNAFRQEDVLLKLHGTIEDRDSWVLTRFQYATAYRKDLWDELRMLFTQHTVLFLGCSLRTDMYLDVLRQIPPGRAAPHYAILNVASRDEADARGPELEKLGILVIPYMTDDGDHGIVDRILADVRPKLQGILTYADRVRREGALDRAMRILMVESEHVSDDVVARARIASRMAEVLRDYRDAHPDPSSWAIDRVVRFARTAATFDPASEVVVGGAVDILRLAGRGDAGLEQRLEELRRPTASGSVSATEDRDIRLAYENLRAGRTAVLLKQLESIQRRGDQDPDRLRILRIRSLLLLGDTDRAEPIVSQLSHAIRPFGDALLAFARNEFTASLAALNVLETRWRASSGGGHPGLVFSLSLRTLVHLGNRDYPAARDCASRAIAAHDPNARQAARRFRTANIPSELCYDVRRLGSSELRTILDCLKWLCGAAQRSTADADDLSELRRLVQRLDRERVADRLLRWYWVLFASLLPDAPSQEELRRTLDELRRDTRSESSGMLPEIRLLFRTATDTVFSRATQTEAFASLVEKP